MVGLICFFMGCCSFELVPESPNYILGGLPFYLETQKKVKTFLENFWHSRQASVGEKFGEGIRGSIWRVVLADRPHQLRNSRVLSREFPQITDRSYGTQRSLARTSRLGLRDNQCN